MPGFNIGGSGEGQYGGPDATRDPYRSYRWRISHLPDFIKSDDWWFAVDCTLPSMEFKELAVQGMSLEYKIPQMPTFPNVDITFYDFGGLQAGFEKWTDRIWNPKKGLFDGKAPTKVKFDIKIDLLDNMGVESKTFTLHGAWPKRITH